MPGMSSSSEVIVRWVRRLRLYVDAEAVRLVAGPLQQPERRGCAATAGGRSARPGRKTSSSRLASLTIGSCRPSPLAPRRVQRGAELPLAAVDHHEVGERLRLLAAAA